MDTYVHINLHPVVSVAIDNGRYYDQRILANEVPYASLVVLAVRGECLDVKLEGVRAGCQQQHAIDVLQERSCPSHGRCNGAGIRSRCRTIASVAALVAKTKKKKVEAEL